MSVQNRRALDPTVRFWRHVDKSPEPNGCWLWTAALNHGGYGLFWTPDGTAKAHRFAYELEVGPIPGGLHIDHLCRTRRCVNPRHMEPVTPTENMRRGFSPAAMNGRMTQCKRGHEFTPENTYIKPSTGDRYCKTCRDEMARRYRASRKAMAA